MYSLLITIFIFGSTTGKVQGRVFDEKTGDPIAYANVIIQNTDMGAATDADGNFFILNVPTGTHSIEASYIGYQTKNIVDVIVEYAKTVRLSIGLNPSAIELSPMTVTSERPAVSKDMVGTTYLVRKSEVTHSRRSKFWKTTMGFPLMCGV